MGSSPLLRDNGRGIYAILKERKCEYVEKKAHSKELRNRDTRLF